MPFIGNLDFYTFNEDEKALLYAAAQIDQALKDRPTSGKDPCWEQCIKEVL
ncbi:hypothetical protein EUX98_g9018, partial [Antrodiella citrinella]